MPAASRFGVRPKPCRPKLGTRLLRPASTTTVPGGVRTPPAFGVPARTVWNTSTTPKSTTVGGTGSGSLTWAAGDLIVVIAATGDQAATINTPTAPATINTLTSIAGPVTTASSCWGRAWVGVANGAGSGVITATEAGTSTDWGMIAWQVTGTTTEGVGNVAAPAASTAAPQVASLVRSKDHSAVFELIADWGAGVGGVGTVPSPRNWTAGFTEREAFGLSGIYNVYAADWADEGTAGTTSYGINVTGSGQNYTRIAVEILGATSAGGRIPTVTSQYAGYF